MKKIVLACLLACAITTATRAASAATGYPCTVQFVPPSRLPTGGSYGSISVEFWDGPFCSGKLLAQPSIWSSGATTTDADSKYLYREAALMQLYRNLVDVTLRGGRILYFTNTTGATLKYFSVSGQY